jgi:hypothetical protein
LPVVQLLPQIVPGHRLWTIASNKSERFIAVEEVYIHHSKSDKAIWVQLVIPRGDLTRIGLTPSRLIKQAQLAAEWREVDDGMDDYVFLEQKTAAKYTGYPSDKLEALVKTVRPAYGKQYEPPIHIGNITSIKHRRVNTRLYCLSYYRSTQQPSI